YNSYVLLLRYLSQVMPPSAFQLIQATLSEITAGRNAGVLTTGLVLALWIASSGMNAVIEGLNVAYLVPEARPWWRRRLVAMALTAALGLLVAGAIFLLAASSSAVERLSQFFPSVAHVAGLSAVLQWSISV